MSNQQAAASFTDKLALGEAKRGENKRRVVVTGGSGKLGRATVKYLSDEGWEVISVDTRRPPTASEDGKSGLGGAYRLVEIDLEDMGAVLETFMTIDMVRVQNMETMKSSCRLT
jgi:NAD(P)-dependent dehydrogenase (short-subunit alcohol dehydrogenase family)